MGDLHECVGECALDHMETVDALFVVVETPDAQLGSAQSNISCADSSKVAEALSEQAARSKDKKLSVAPPSIRSAIINCIKNCRLAEICQANVISVEPPPSESAEDATHNPDNDIQQSSAAAA